MYPALRKLAVAVAATMIVGIASAEDKPVKEDPSEGCNGQWQGHSSREG